MGRKYNGEDLRVLSEIARMRKQYMEDLHVENQADLTFQQMLNFVNLLYTELPGFSRLVQKNEKEDGIPGGPERSGDFN